MEITGVNRNVPLNIETVQEMNRTAEENRELVRAVQALNGTDMFGPDNRLRFQYDPEVHRVIVRLVNTKTDEVVMQIPDEYLLRVAQELDKQSR